MGGVNSVISDIIRIMFYDPDRGWLEMEVESHEKAAVENPQIQRPMPVDAEVPV